MQRQINNRPLQWADKTMSVIRADQLEICEKELAGMPDCSLFDPNCDDNAAEKLYDLSWFSTEDRSDMISLSLHTIQELRNRVLASFAYELSLLAPEEHDLLIRLALFGGNAALQDWNELLPARSLVRRLWCRCSRKEGAFVLHMPHQLCSMALLILASDDHRFTRDIVEKVIDGIDNTLYLTGIMHASAPVAHLQSLLKDKLPEKQSNLIRRMLCAAFDYMFDRDGHLILIHPGLADPEHMMSRMADYSRCADQCLTEEALSDASSSVMDLESPLYDQMLASLNGAIRPEMTAEDAVEDLIILAKQNVPLAEMKKVLSSMLVSFPTEEMLSSLSHISSQVPRWLSFSASQVQ